jgi:hypothetical protein
VVICGRWNLVAAADQPKVPEENLRRRSRRRSCSSFEFSSGQLAARDGDEISVTKMWLQSCSDQLQVQENFMKKFRS